MRERGIFRGGIIGEILSTGGVFSAREVFPREILRGDIFKGIYKGEYFPWGKVFSRRGHFPSGYMNALVWG